jgi:hypothetical protein
VSPQQQLPATLTRHNRRLLHAGNEILPASSSQAPPKSLSESAWTVPESLGSVSSRQILQTLQNGSSVASRQVVGKNERADLEPSFPRKTVLLLVLMAFLCGVIVMALMLWCFAVCCLMGENAPDKFHSSSQDAMLALREKGSENIPDAESVNYPASKRESQVRHATGWKPPYVQPSRDRMVVAADTSYNMEYCWYTTGSAGGHAARCIRSPTRPPEQVAQVTETRVKVASLP